MQRIPFTLQLKYSESYLPSARHRKPRWRTATKTFKVSIPSLSREEADTLAPEAFILSDYRSVHDNKTRIRTFRGKLFVRMDMTQFTSVTDPGHDNTIDALLAGNEERLKAYFMLPAYYTPVGEDLPVFVKRIREEAHRYLVIDGFLWEQIGEPRYVIMTYGLGHNHGGTSLSVHTCYNSNIHRDRYFNALQGKEAVAEAVRIATARGDDKSVPYIQESITVLRPEAVKVNPRRQHGTGDPFLNRIEKIIEKSPDATTAGLLTVAETIRQTTRP